MRIKITAGGVHGVDGQEIPIGTIIPVEAEPQGLDGRYELVDDSDAKGKTAVTNPANPAPPPPPPPEFVPPTGPFTAKERSPGWWAIYDGADAPVGKSVRKGELEGFDSLSDEDKATFATEHAKASFDAEQKKS